MQSRHHLFGLPDLDLFIVYQSDKSPSFVWFACYQSDNLFFLLENLSMNTGI